MSISAAVSIANPNASDILTLLAINDLFREAHEGDFSSFSINIQLFSFRPEEFCVFFENCGANFPAIDGYTLVEKGMHDLHRFIGKLILFGYPYDKVSEAIKIKQSSSSSTLRAYHFNDEPTSGLIGSV